MQMKMLYFPISPITVASTLYCKATNMEIASFDLKSQLYMLFANIGA